MGTCDYMAPEQAESTHRADHRADIYSLGCTLFRLVAGRPPYMGETAINVAFAHRDAPIPSLRSVRAVPPQLDAVFEKMVAKRCEDRYQSMADVIAELEAVARASAQTAGEISDKNGNRGTTRDGDIRQACPGACSPITRTATKEWENAVAADAKKEVQNTASEAIASQTEPKTGVRVGFAKRLLADLRQKKTLGADRRGTAGDRSHLGRHHPYSQPP